MFKKILEQLRWKRLARQLRKPEGPAGIEVARRMNTANEFLYDFTLDEMHVGNHQSILEIGFGNGKFFYKQFNRAEELRITGLDFSEDMIREAKSINQDYLEQGKLVLVKGQSDKMPFQNASFDIIFCINVAYFWNEPQDHLEEIHRVLKPGGRFYTTIRTPESLAIASSNRPRGKPGATWEGKIDHAWQALGRNPGSRRRVLAGRKRKRCYPAGRRRLPAWKHPDGR